MPYFTNRGITPLPSGSTLKSGLIGCWELEESTGATRADSHTNGINLTDFGTVTQVTGKVGSFGASFTGDNVVLYNNTSIESEDDFDVSGMSIATWVYFPTAIPTVSPYLITKVGQFILSYDFGNLTFGFGITNGGTNPAVFSATFGTPSANTWYFVVATADNTNIKISVNAGAQNSTAQGGNISVAANPLYLGSTAGGPSFSAFYLDQVGLWNRALTPAEITTLYAGGSGLAYSGM